MVKGRKPKPSHLKLITGNPGHRSLNANEPKPALARPDAPDFLETYAKEEWGRVIDYLYNLGLMSHLDVMALAAYCDAYAQWRNAKELQAEIAARHPNSRGLVYMTAKNKDGKGGGNLIQNPIVGVVNRARAEMLRCMIEFGMTPSARARIDAEAAATAQAQDPLEEFFGEAG